jgi:hypothetical protein
MNHGFRICAFRMIATLGGIMPAVDMFISPQTVGDVDGVIASYLAVRSACGDDLIRLSLAKNLT